MANHKSAEKRSRQSERRCARNTMIKSGLKTAVKKVYAAVAQKDEAGAQKALSETIPALSRAAAKGVHHPKAASRKISRLTRRVNALPKTSA